MSEPLETPRLVLKPARLSTVVDVHKIFADPQAAYWSISGVSPSLKHTEQVWNELLAAEEKAAAFIWTVYTRDCPNTVIGIVQLKVRSDHDPGETVNGTAWAIAYMFLGASWGKGYATESVGAMINAIAPKTRPCTLLAYINPANPPSAKVAVKLGFMLDEKIYRPDEPKVFIGGEWREYDVWRCGNIQGNAYPGGVVVDLVDGTPVAPVHSSVGFKRSLQGHSTYFSAHCNEAEYFDNIGDPFQRAMATGVRYTTIPQEDTLFEHAVRRRQPRDSAQSLLVHNASSLDTYPEQESRSFVRDKINVVLGYYSRL